RRRRELRSEAGGHAGDEQVVLDADRRAVDQAARGAGAPTRLGGARARQRAVAIDPAKGIDGAVVAIDAIENGTHHLDRRELLAAIAREQLRGRQERGVIVGSAGDGARASVARRSYLMPGTSWPRLRARASQNFAGPFAARMRSSVIRRFVE